MDSQCNDFEYLALQETKDNDTPTLEEIGSDALESKSSIRHNPSFYLRLFLTVLQISAMTFGGGFVIISFLRRAFVEKLGWMNEDEIINLTSIAQCSPGAIAVNVAFLIGHKLAGAAGAFLSILATVIPPFFILTAISYAYDAVAHHYLVQCAMVGMQAGVAAIIVDTAVSLVQIHIKNRPLISVCIMTGVFFAIVLFSVNLFLIILVSALAGILFCRKKEEKI